MKKNNINPEDVLQKIFGKEHFRGNQKNIIDCVMQGKDSFVLMPTGGGKSLCYQIPAICLEGLGVVISPLIALMQDQVVALKAKNIEAEFLNSTLDDERCEKIIKKALSGKLKLIYAAPETFNLAYFQGFLQKTKVNLFAIDEAHCISQWGYEFRPEYTNLSSIKKMFPNTPIIALTATADKDTRNDIIKNLHLENVRIFKSSFDRPNIHYAVQIKTNEQEQIQLLNFIKQNHPNESGIIYCCKKKTVDLIVEFLTQQGFKVFPYYSGLDEKTGKKAREIHQNKFMSEKGVIIVATTAFGMGIDKPDVRFVVHFDPPDSIEKYYQETGRAGRDGNPANTLLLWDKKIINLYHFTRDQSEADESRKEIARKKLSKLVSFAYAKNCRRKVLLNSLDETYEKQSCGNCDNCVKSIKNTHTQVEKKLMSGKLLKQKMFEGKFKNKEQVEEFIVSVLEQSPTVLQDFLDQCGEWAFNKYHVLLEYNPDISTDKLAGKIGSDSSSGSQFSHWIRARFIQEIFKLNTTRGSVKKT